MASEAGEMYTAQDGRFETSAWLEHGAILTQVLDLHPRTPDSECRFLSLQFYGTDSQCCRVQNDVGGVYICVNHGGSRWTCNCRAAISGRPCYHVRAVRAAEALAARQKAIGEQEERRAWRQRADRELSRAPLAGALRA